MEGEQSTSKRKAPSCSRCRNHGADVPLTHHKCQYEQCSCVLCKLTWYRQEVMRKQQQLWRQRKESQRWGDTAAEAVPGGPGYDDDVEEGGSKQKEKYCDMCRNHGQFVRNRGHKSSCRFENCACNFCDFTRKRRMIMQLQQKVKRSGVTAEQFQQQETKLVADLMGELAKLGIESGPMPTVPSTQQPANITPQGHYHTQHPPHSHTAPPQPSVEGQYSPNIRPYSPNIPQELYPTAQSTNLYPYPSSSRPYTHLGHIPSVEEYPSHRSAPYGMEPAHSPPCSSAVSLTPCTTASIAGPSGATASVAGLPGATALVAGPTGATASGGGMSHYGAAPPGRVHLAMDSPYSFASLCPPSPSYNSLPGSPLSDYHGCPSPLLSCFNETDYPGYDMTSVQQQSSAVIRTTQASEPLECTDQQKHCSRSQKHAKSSLLEHSENPSLHLIKHMYKNPQNPQATFGNEHRDVDEISQEPHRASQRRRSEGVIQTTYQYSQRRNSDSLLQGTIYRPGQRRNSDGVIKMYCGPNQRGTNDTVIQEGQVHDDREVSEDSPQKHLRTDRMSDTSQGAAEEYHIPEKRIQTIYQLDQRRNSDGGILTLPKPHERRMSDGVIRNCFASMQRPLLEKFTQKHKLYAPESDELMQSSYQSTQRRSSDEISQGSSVYDLRRGSLDLPPESYGSYERRNSDDPLRNFYALYPRSDSGETIPEDNWPNRRRDSDELSHRNYPSGKEHFFENTLRREHEAFERINKTVPFTDASTDFRSERAYFAIQPPRQTQENQQDQYIQKEVSMQISTVDSVSIQEDAMSWSSHPNDGERDIHAQDVDEMEGPLDLTTRPSKRH